MLLALFFILKKYDAFFNYHYGMTWRLLAMPAACVVMEWLMKHGVNAVTRFFEWFGRYSLEIYVLHMLVVTFMKDFMATIGLEPSLIPVLHVAVTFVIVIALCVPVHRMIDILVTKLRVNS